MDFDSDLKNSDYSGLDYISENLEIKYYVVVELYKIFVGEFYFESL